MTLDTQTAQSARQDLQTRVIGSGANGVLIVRSGRDHEAQLMRGGAVVSAQQEHHRKFELRAIAPAPGGSGSIEVKPFGPGNPAPLLVPPKGGVVMTPKTAEVVNPSVAEHQPVEHRPAAAPRFESVDLPEVTAVDQPVDQPNYPIAPAPVRTLKRVTMDTPIGDVTVDCYDVILNERTQVITLVLPQKAMCPNKPGITVEINLNGKPYIGWCPGLHTEIEMFGIAIAQFTYKTPEQVQAEKDSGH